MDIYIYSEGHIVKYIYIIICIFMIVNIWIWRHIYVWLQVFIVLFLFYSFNFYLFTFCLFRVTPAVYGGSLFFQLFRRSLTFKNKCSGGVPWWLSRLRIWHCHCYGLGHFCGEGLMSGPGTSTCHGCCQKLHLT